MHEVVVFDTNVLISAALSSRGSPFRCLALAKTHAIQSVTCREILDEFREKLSSKLGFTPQEAVDAVLEIEKLSDLVGIAHAVQGCFDPDDDKILECAVTGNATHIVTGDKRHLLPLGTFQGIAIVNPADFLHIVAGNFGPSSP